MFQLGYARAALAVAQRELDDLRAISIQGPRFADRVPLVLECLLNVTRQINAEAKQRQKSAPYPDFWAWWKELPNPVPEYRNAMLKGNPNGPGGWEKHTRIEVTATFPDGASVVTSDLSVRATDGEVVYVRDVLQLPKEGQAVWYFRDGPWHDRPVIETLTQRLDELRNNIIPIAERLLS